MSLKLPGIQQFRSTDRTGGASAADGADKSSSKKSIGGSLRKFGTQLKHGVRDAVKNMNTFSNKLSGKVHDLPQPVVHEAVQHARAEIRNQDAAFRRQCETPPHAQLHQPARVQSSHQAEWATVQFERRQREKEINLLKFDMLRRHPGEVMLDPDIIPQWDKEAQRHAHHFQKRIGDAEMALARYVQGDARIDVRAALRDIRAAQDGMQHLLRGVEQRERSAATAAAAAAAHAAEADGPAWDRSKIPSWNRELKRKVDRLMAEYEQVADYDDYGMVEMQRTLAKAELDDIFAGIAEREKTEQRVMRNFNAGF